MLVVEFLNHPRCVLQVGCRLPGVVLVIVAFPFHPILQPLPAILAVQNLLYLILQPVLILPLDRCWWFRQQTIDQVPLKQIKLVDMEDGVVAVKLLRKVQSVIQISHFL